MAILTIIFIAMGLAMDAFSVSIAAGAGHKEKIGHGHALRMAFFFGFFQGMMLLAGWALGENFKHFIESFDHWVAFVLLAGVGVKMIYDSFSRDDEDKRADPTGLWVLLCLSVATSIDAFAVGVTLSLITEFVVWAAVIIAIVTFVFSYAGVYIGKRIGHFFENKIEVVGGMVLIAMGVKILLEHLLVK